MSTRFSSQDEASNVLRLNIYLSQVSHFDWQSFFERPVETNGERRYGMLTGVDRPALGLGPEAIRRRRSTERAHGFALEAGHCGLQQVSKDILALTWTLGC